MAENNANSSLSKQSILSKIGIWELIKEKLKAYLEEEKLLNWIEPIKPNIKESQDQSPSELTLEVPNVVFLQGLKEEFSFFIEKAKAELGLNIHILYKVEGYTSKSSFVGEFSNDLPTSTLTGQNPGSSPNEGPNPGKPLNTQNFKDFDGVSIDEKTAFDIDVGESFFTDFSARQFKLDPQYTFDSFVIGPSNQFSHASCLRVAEAPGQAYNPLFIYGFTGLGKTHLLHAVGNAVKKDNPNAVVTFVRCEEFMFEMVHCIRYNKMEQFRQKYRFCDVLLVDDIQFIKKKERTQEEFFHTFNSLYEAKKQIIITSDMFPQDIPDISERLRSRFQWGLIADIQPPDVEHRMAILMSKADELGVKLPQNVAEFIAQHIKKNVRELEGALHRIAGFATLYGRVIDLKLAVDTFQNILSEPPKRLSVETIQKIVADHYRVKVSELKSKKRHRALTLPRQIAMYLSRDLTNASYPEIGDRFGGKDHTTVLHAVRKIEQDRHIDHELKAHLEALSRLLEQQT